MVLHPVFLDKIMEINQKLHSIFLLLREKGQDEVALQRIFNFQQITPIQGELRYREKVPFVLSTNSRTVSESLLGHAICSGRETKKWV